MENKTVESQSPPPTYQEIKSVFLNNANNANITETDGKPSNSLLGQIPAHAGGTSETNLSTSHFKDFTPQTDFFQKPPKFLLYPVRDGNPAKENKEYSLRLENTFLSSNDTVNTHQNPSVFSVPTGKLFTSIPDGYPIPYTLGVPLQSLLFDDKMARHSQRVLCPYCRVGVNTTIKYVNGTMKHLSTIKAYCSSCFFCIPNLIKDRKDVEHYCPECSKILGCSPKMDG